MTARADQPVLSPPRTLRVRGFRLTCARKRVTLSPSAAVRPISLGTLHPSRPCREAVTG